MTLTRLILVVSFLARSGNAELPQGDDFETLMAKATAGDASAQDAVGRAYRNGETVPKNYGQAVHWFQLAADQGLPRAVGDLALMYEAGWGVAEDHAEAARLHGRAAGQGDVASMMAVWLDYDTGRGVPQDYEEAVRWCRLLANQADTPPETRITAEQALGDYYRIGKGVTQDYQEAARWYRLAGDHGDARSQYYLGLLYGQGLGLRQDYIEAHKWLNLAASRGFPNAAKMRDTVAASMSPLQVRKAQELARAWKPAP